MDDAQSNHLKAYGVTYRALQRGGRAEWLLNYRGGSFLLPADTATERDAALTGVTVEPASDGDVVAVRGEIQANNMDAVPLEKAPKVAVYVPPNAAPWDDAVTMSLEYAGIEYQKIWDPDVLGGRLKDFEWLHLHHEDFTGQYSKFYLAYSGAFWLSEMVERNQETARRLGLPNVPALKKAVAREIRRFVQDGGFLFAMCTATETIEIALAAEGVDVAAPYADGTSMDPDASAKLDWARSFAFRDVKLEQSS
ncbi:MAG: asparagine synthetase B, partial [Gemmatimonadetes bacterium]|nr:asparagine synthetase B [Gemmatimonadota bacterium]